MTTRTGAPCVNHSSVGHCFFPFRHSRFWVRRRRRRTDGQSDRHFTRNGRVFRNQQRIRHVQLRWWKRHRHAYVLEESCARVPWPKALILSRPFAPILHFSGKFTFVLKFSRAWKMHSQEDFSIFESPIPTCTKATNVFHNKKYSNIRARVFAPGSVPIIRKLVCEWKKSKLCLIPISLFNTSYFQHVQLRKQHRCSFSHPPRQSCESSRNVCRRLVAANILHTKRHAVITLCSKRLL